MPRNKGKTRAEERVSLPTHGEETAPGSKEEGETPAVDSVDSSEMSGGQNDLIYGDKTYKVGDTFSVSGHQVTAVAYRPLKSSPNSGVPAGTYPIVSATLHPGNRVVFRALVGDDLYPIRSYGTPEEVISKIRKERTSSARSRPGTASSARDPDQVEESLLSREAAQVLDEYLVLKTGVEREQVVSSLVMTHLAPEVKQLRAAREAVARLPADLLALLVNATEEKRRQFMDMLR